MALEAEDAADSEPLLPPREIHEPTPLDAAETLEAREEPSD